MLNLLDDRSQNIFKFDIISMKKTQTYRISLIEGDYFFKDSFFKSAFEHFSLLSWLSSASHVQILDQQTIQLHQRQYKLYTFTINHSIKPSYLLQFSKNYQKYQISYCPFTDKNLMMNAINHLEQLQQKIKVIFSIHKETSKLTKDKKRSVVYIDITDEQGYFRSWGVKRLQRKISDRPNRIKDNEIHYPFKEPLSQRNKEIPNCHFNLAFQGGGAKGVSYVGVYKALKEVHKNIQISSVIGSSAGGILALAISSEMSPSDISDLCLEMDSIPKDKYFKNQKQITPQLQKHFDSLIFKIKCLLHNYGIVQSSVFDQFAESICDIETNNKILKVLECINPSIAQLFSLELCQPIEKSGYFWQQRELYTNRLNYYGILMAGMMKGDAVEDIAASCLISFMQKHFDDFQLKKKPSLKDRVPIITNIINKWGFNQINDGVFQSQQFRKKIKTLTLKEYYAITQIEFTCTSVDLNDQILRFFNHKTTPNLPVCKTVQMTGSFPVAFQAQKWKEEWGKYYVHYENTRKQIDLTGHQFTDGGLLANFPIKYLDNDHMRPMYFSHKQNSERTILYGFGLDYIEDPQKNKKQHKQQLEKAIEDLKLHIQSKFSKTTFLKNLIMGSSKELPNVQLSEIPLIEYVLKLLKTFTVADYNLNMQCFQKSIIQTNISGRVIQNTKNLAKQIKKYAKFEEYLDSLQTISRSKQNAKPNQILLITCEKLKQLLTQYENIQHDKIQAIRLKILQSLYNYEGSRIKNRLEASPQINVFIKSLQNLYPQQFFKMQATQQIKYGSIEIINKIQEYFKNIPKKFIDQVTIIYNSMLQSQLQTIKRIRERSRKIIESLKDIKYQQIENDQYAEVTFIDYQLVFDLISMQRKFFIVDQEYLKQIMSEIKKLDLPVISIDKEILDNAIHTQYHLNNIVSKAKSNKIHLVFQSKENSHLYYCGLYSILQEVLNQSQNQDKKIQMITCADYHSVFAFLLAGGKKINNIRKQMWKIKDLITIEKNIQQQYKTFKWAQTYSQEMNELLDLTWKDQYKLFQQVEKYLGQAENHSLKDQIRKMKMQYLYSKDQIGNAMQNVLNYVMQSIKQSQKVEGSALRKKKLAQLLSLKNGRKGRDYQSKNKIISKNTQRIINKLMFHFEEIITYIILNNYFVASTFQQFDESMKENVWRGVLIKRLLSSKKLELYIKQKLQEMKLNSNTTLSQFYQFSPRKITINFTLINKREQRLQIINRFTKPNMPLWAAIIASTSMPYVLPQFACNQQWQFSPLADSRMRKMVNYFFNTSQQKSVQTFYVASNFVSTLPLQFLTNQKIARENYTSIKNHEQLEIKLNQLQSTSSTAFQHEKRMIEEETQYTYITFSFTKTNNQGEYYKYKAGDKKFLTFSNLLNLGIDYILGRFKNIEVGFKDILKRVQLLKLLETRIECHDNTIMYYYKDQTIKLPIRLGTLDFYKIQKDKQANLNSCIYQAEFVVRGIFQNLHVNQTKKVFTYLAKKQTYLQFKTEADQIYIKFPSKSKWNKQLLTMYRIFYKQNMKQKYVQYQQEWISFHNSVDMLYLKIVFPNMKTMRLQEQQMQLDFKKLLQNEEYEQNLIFRFNYEMVAKRCIKGVHLDNNKLKTKILPSFKSVATEQVIQQSAIILVKSTSAFSARKEGSDNQDDPEKCLIVKTIVNFKFNGLFCHCCMHQLKRIKFETDNLQVGNCGKCKNSFNIIGLECQDKRCLQKDQNRYCFPCLLVYLIHRKEGKYICTLQEHQFKYCTLGNNSQIQLCHFCSLAANNYYKDQKCNINICFKCSLILDSQTTISL